MLNNHALKTSFDRCPQHLPGMLFLYETIFQPSPDFLPATLHLSRFRKVRCYFQLNLHTGVEIISNKKFELSFWSFESYKKDQWTSYMILGNNTEYLKVRRNSPQACKSTMLKHWESTDHAILHVWGNSLQPCKPTMFKHWETADPAINIANTAVVLYPCAKYNTCWSLKKKKHYSTPTEPWWWRRFCTIRFRFNLLSPIQNF